MTRSDSTKRKISLANSGSGNGMWHGGKPHCPDCGKELWWGSTYCRSHVKRPWLLNPQRIKESTERLLSLVKNEVTHPRWKGENAGYISIHKWVRKHLGKPSTCSICGTNEKRRYEWANSKGMVSRNLEDYVSMCVPCHRRYDDIGNKVWAVRRKK